MVDIIGGGAGSSGAPHGGVGGLDNPTGPGGTGGDATSNIYGGGGGGAGTTGGAGGNGGFDPNFGTGGQGGTGGSHGYVGSALPTAAKTGTAGGAGQSGGVSVDGGGGGGGGYGAVVTGTGSLGTLTSAVTGGTGGAGGSGDVGGNGGRGGVGLYVLGSAPTSVSVAAAVTGGAGGAGDIIFSGVSHGGEGVIGHNLSLTLLSGGSLTGGVDNDRNAMALGNPPTHASAVLFESGTNVLEIQGGSITGNVVANGADDTFRLAGSTGGSFDISTIQGFEAFQSSGTATWTVTGTNTTSASWTASSGKLLVNGSLANEAFTVGNGATLGGSGTVGAVAVQNGGHFAAGNSPGVIHTGNLSLVSGASFDEEIGGTTAGTEYDQTIVAGSVSLNGATLNLSQYNNFVPSAGQSFKIIDNDGTSDAVVGTFDNLAEGATVMLAGKTLSISYHGGDGNDVVLTAIVVTNQPAVAHDDPNLINIVGETASYTRLAAYEGTIVDPGIDITADNINFDFSRDQIRLTAGGFGIVGGTLTYALANSDFVFTSAALNPATNLPSWGSGTGTFTIVDGAIVEVLDAGSGGISIGSGEALIIDFTLGLKEDGTFSGDLFADNGNGADADPEGDAFSVTQINGVNVTDGQVVTLASGALLTIHADGTFGYDANHAFDSLAAGQTAQESFTYTITGGSSATASFTVAGANTAPTLTGDLGAAVQRGATVLIGASDLGYTDPDDNAAGVTFTVSNLVNGTILVNGNAATTFTGTQLAAGQVSFQHDGSQTTSASFDVWVEDGNEDGSAPVAQAFSLTVNQAAEAQSLVVTTLSDVVDAYDNLTSLREAIAYANSHANADANTPDVITFANGLNGSIRLTGGTLIVTDAVKIDGDLGSDGKPKITISGDANGDDSHIAGSTVITNIAASQTAGKLSDNVQIIRTSANLTLDGLVLTGGTATGSDISDARGGAVGAFNSASPGAAVSVTATATTFEGNSAVSSGGAISASGTVTLDSSTVSGNVSGSALSGVGGGGVFASVVNLTNATISGNNAAGSGGGVFGTTVTMMTSTVSGNHSTGAGGGVFSSTNVTATNSILSGNDANSGNDDSTTPLFFHGLNVYSAWLYNDSGFFGYAPMDAVFASVTANPYTGISSGTLADNGGPVRTIALKDDPANPALDSGRDTSPGVDARGLARHDYSDIPDKDGTLGRDLGAFELQDNIASIAKNDAINILGVTVAYNPVVSATTQAAIADPGAEFQDGDLASNLSGTRLVLSSANDFYVAHDYTYTLSGSQFVFTSVTAIDGGEYGANVSVVNGALVVHDPEIYHGEDIVLGFTVGLKENGSFSGNLFADNGNGADNDPDGDTFAVTKINDAAVTDGQIVTLPSGARLTIHTDGTFSYDTNHAFDSLNDGQTASESFTYTITGGGTATMSFTIVGEGSAPDTTPPTITIGTIAGDDVVSAAEGAATITVSGTAVGAEDGQTVTLWLKTIDGSTGLQSMTTTVSGGAWHIDLPPGATPAFPDGPYLVTADVSDAAGNPATQATRTITVDTHAPSITINTIAGDDVVSAAEGAATITVSGTAVGAEDGQSVTLWLKTIDGSTGLQSMTTTVSGGAWHIDLPPGATPAFPDGPYLVTADVSDAAGNPATQATRTITGDTHAPSITINTIAGDDVVSAAEGAATITVSGTATGAEDGQTVTLALKTGNGSTTLQVMTAAVVAGLWHIDLPPGATPAFPDGDYLVTANVADQAGNSATEAARTIHVDVHAPTVTIDPIAGDDIVNAAEGAGVITVSGTAAGVEDGQTVTLALKTGDGSVTLQTMATTVSGGAWHLDLPPGATPAFPNGHYLVTADVSDAAGNPAPEAARGITVDIAAVAAATPSPFQHTGTGYPGPHGGFYATPGVSDGFFVTATGDFNGDGTSDVLWRDASGRVDEWSMHNESWANSVYLGARGAEWQVAGTGDFNGDGTDDVLWRNPNTGQFDAWIMQNGQWSRSVDLGARPTDWKVLGVGDFNGDGTDDILFQNSKTGAVDGWQMANGNWAKSLSLGGSRDLSYSSVFVGDFDGDGTSDVLWRNPTTGAVDQWHIRDGNWAGSIDLGTFNTGYELAAVNDFNNDGTTDVLWRNPTTGQVDGWVMDHGRWFASVALGSFDPAYHLGGTGDFNHSGGADILWHNTTTGQTSTWLLGPA